MPSVVVMGSCLTNLAALFLISDYKWERPNNAAVLRSDYFVDQFIHQRGYLPSKEAFLSRVRWKDGFDKEGPRWLHECYRDTVGHVEVPLEQPGLFETLENKNVDLILMDNLHDTHTLMLRKRAVPGEPDYALPFSMSRCENEQELAQDHYYGPNLSAEDSAASWEQIVRYTRELQPKARIMFYCAHSCTSIDLPDRFQRADGFFKLFAPKAAELGIQVVPPLNLPPHLTRMPEDRDHYEWLVYKALAGKMFLDYAMGG
jgi:hypothetical protein